MNTRKEIRRFLIAGVLVGATDFGIYYFLIGFLPFSLSKGIGFICAGIVAYLFNKRWTFRRKQPADTLSRYLFINFLALGVNVLTNQSVLNAQPGAILPAFIVAAMLTSLFTFICFKWWVFGVELKEKP